MPSPNEIEVLRITKEEKEVGKSLISSRMGISNEYSALILNCLAGKGFLKKFPAKEGTYRTDRTGPRYKLTRKGALVFLARLYHTEGQYTSAARRALFLKDVVDEKIDEMTDFIEEEFPGKRISAERKEKTPVSVPARVK